MGADQEDHTPLGLARRSAQESLPGALQVLAQQKDNVKACLLLGDVYRKQKRIEEAADMYDKAIELQGEDVPGKVYVRLGRVQLELGRYDDARDNYLWGAKVCLGGHCPWADLTGMGLSMCGLSCREER